MKAIVIEQYGGPEELVERDIPEPGIQSDQVLIELHATAVNPVDWKVREGYLRNIIPFQFPLVPGWDAAGVIRAKGKNVNRFQVGDEVFARTEMVHGTYAEYVAAGEDKLAFKPGNVDFQQAAALPLAGLMAWQCLLDFGQVQADDKVLILGGSGGVGSIGIQIAKSLGAYVLATASGKNEALLKELGVDVFIDYETTDFTDVIQDADVVIDTIGGDVLAKSYDVLRPRGILGTIAGDPDPEKAEDKQIIAESIRLHPNGKQLGQLGEMVEKGQVMPYIGHRFPFTADGLREAHRLSASHHARGKIVIPIQ